MIIIVLIPRALDVTEKKGTSYFFRSFGEKVTRYRYSYNSQNVTSYRYSVIFVDKKIKISLLKRVFLVDFPIRLVKNVHKRKMPPKASNFFQKNIFFPLKFFTKTVKVTKICVTLFYRYSYFFAT